MKNTLSIFCLTVLLAACGNNEEKQTEEVVTEPAKPTLTVSNVAGSPEYDGATIGMGKVEATAANDSVKLTFNFNVKNYELKSQTADAGSKMCNNSAQGQHIHFILNNQPYAALYEPKHSVTVAKNTEHYLMAFLSRSYHESVKTKGAALVYHFKVDENGKVQQLDEPTTPMVFYSRPKGDYVGEKDTKNLLLDYYIWNTTLGADASQVMAHVKGDGVDTTLALKEWKPQFLHNMPMGKSNITLTLADKDGKKLDGPMTEVTREFGLSADEPLAQ